MEKIDSKKLQEIFEQIKQTNIGKNTNIIPLSDWVYVTYDKVNNRFYLFFFDKTELNDNSDTINLEIIDMRTSEYAKYPIPLNEYINISEGQAMITFAEKYIEIFTKDSNKETLK